MSRAAVNANVRVAQEGDLGALLRNRIVNMAEFCEEYGMTNTAVYRRLNDPDMWTVGQLRQLRATLGLSKEELLDIVRVAL